MNQCKSLLLLVMTASSLAWLPAALSDELRPDLVPRPSLQPEEVVRIQLAALANNDAPHPDAGIEITFRFASPGNRRQTGPLPRFIELVKNPVYAPMIDHQKAEIGETRERDGRVLVPVVLTAAGGDRAAYVFVVGRQKAGECPGCWMTESVLRVPLAPPEERPKGSGLSA